MLRTLSVCYKINVSDLREKGQNVCWLCGVLLPGELALSICM